MNTAETRTRLAEHLIDRAPAAIIATDMDGIVLYWNRGAEALYGWSADEAVGASVMNLVVDPKTRDESVEIMKGLERGQAWEGELWLTRKDGSRLLAHVSDTPVFDAAGGQIALIGVSVDVSEHRFAGASGYDAAIGRRIASARKAAGITQGALAQRLGVSVRSVQGYEAGATSARRRLNEIAEVLNVGVDWLVAGQPLAALFE
jgi:PAS domain S-box-containing protein